MQLQLFFTCTGPGFTHIIHTHTYIYFVKLLSLVPLVQFNLFYQSFIHTCQIRHKSMLIFKKQKKNNKNKTASKLQLFLITWPHPVSRKREAPTVLAPQCDHILLLCKTPHTERWQRNSLPFHTNQIWHAAFQREWFYWPCPPVSLQTADILPHLPPKTRHTQQPTTPPPM